MSQAEGQQPAPAQAAAPNGQAKSRTVPKLAPAPVPQQTPWKAPVIDATTAKANFEAVDAAQNQRRSKNVAAQRAREANKEVAAAAPAAAAAASTAPSTTTTTSTPSSSAQATKRATTGKEKWVPYTPVIPAGSGSSSSSNSNSSRSRQNKRQSGSYRQRRSGGSQNDRGSSNGSSSGSNNEKRKSGSQSQSSSVRGNNGAGHQRSQPRSGNNKSDRSSASSTSEQQASNANGNSSTNNSNSSSIRGSQEPPVAGVEKLQVTEDGSSKSADANSQQQNQNQNAGNASSPSMNSHSRPMQDRRPHTKQGYIPRSQNGPRKPRDPRFSGPKMPYFQGGYMTAPPHGAQMGYLPMQTMQMPAASSMPTVVSALSPPQDLLMAYLIGQVDYYFSVENLCKDTFLRKNMNNEGLVPISVIADFKRVKNLTTELSLVAEACTQAANIEVIGSKVRAVVNHHLWVFPEADRLPAGLDNGLESAKANPIPTSSASTEGSNSEPKFQVDQAVPFVPKSASENQ